MAMDTRRYQKRQAAQGQVDIHTSSVPGLLVLTVGILIFIVGVILLVAIGVTGKLQGKYLAGPVCMGVGGVVVVIGVVVAIYAKHRRSVKKQQRRVSPNGGKSGQHGRAEGNTDIRHVANSPHGNGYFSNDPHSQSGVVIHDDV